jgi:peptidyl-prolyl cis-trans isomerase SurA
VLAFAPARLAAQDTAQVVRWQPDIPVDRVVAVVGSTPILWSDVLFGIGARLRGQRPPEDPAVQAALAREVLTQMVDEELLIQTAQADTALKVADSDVAPQVDDAVKRVRDQFRSEAEFREALGREGYASADEYRRKLVDDARRSALQERLISKLRQEGKLLPAPVTEAELAEAFEGARGQLPKRPPTVAFRQIAVAPRATPAARDSAYAKIVALAEEIRKGADFEQVAKRESMDTFTREVGGDLGWNRRGRMVPEFDRMMFALTPGVVSPVVETVFGFHIIRVDRVQPAEVKARHILIRPRIDSTDVARARLRADTVLQQWRAGVPFDTLVARFHDPSEDRGSIDPFDRTQLPPSYQQALEGKGVGDFAGPFAVDDRRTGTQKFMVLQVLSQSEGGEYTLEEFRDRVREQLAQEKALRRYLDTLRRRIHVSVRLDAVIADPGA